MHHETMNIKDDHWPFDARRGQRLMAVGSLLGALAASSLSVDRQPNAACALPLLHCHCHACFPRLRLLARLAFVASGLYRWRGVRKTAPEPAREDRADRRDGARDGRARLRLPRTCPSHIMNGETS